MITEVPATVVHTYDLGEVTADDITKLKAILLEADIIRFNFTTATGVEGTVNHGLTYAKFETELTKYIGDRLRIMVERPQIKLLPVS